MQPAWHFRYKTSIARTLLVTVWTFPCLATLWVFLFPEFPSPILLPGVGNADSDRTILLMLSLAALALVTPPKSWRDWGASGWFALAFLGWCGVSSLIGSDPVGSLFFSQVWIAAVCVLAAFPRVAPEQISPRARVALLHLPVACLAVMGLVPLFFGSDLPRAAGPFQLPGVLSNWLVFVLPLVLSDLLRIRGHLFWPVLINSVLSLSLLVLTFSRMAWFLGAVQLAFVLLLESPLTMRRVGTWTLYLVAGITCVVSLRTQLSGFAFLVAILAIGVIPVLVEFFRKNIATASLVRLGSALCIVAVCVFLVGRLRPQQTFSDNAKARLETLSTNDSSATSRLEFWRASLAMTNANAVFGVGPGKFSVHFPQYQREFYFYSDSPHNTFLELAAEVGWLGALLFLCAIVALARDIQKGWNGGSLQRSALLGVVSGCLFACIEVSYQFATLWTTLAFLAAMMRRPTPEEAQSSSPLRLVGGGVALVGLGLLVPLQRDRELSLRLLDPKAAFELSEPVASSLPIWPAPSLAALEQGLDSSQPSVALHPIVERILSLDPHDAGAYQLVGDFFLRERRLGEARSAFERSVKLDPFNRPVLYYNLLSIASQTGDTALKQRVTDAALARFAPLDQLKTAHEAHRALVSAQLIPLMYTIADGLSPYNQPERTEPLYRFLVERDRAPRSLHGLGVSLWTQQRFEEARPYLQQAHDINPFFPEPPP